MTRAAERAAAAAASVAIGTAAWGAGRLHPALDPVVLGLLGGLAAGTLLGRRAALASGCRAAQRVFVPAGIVLYATNLRLDLLSVASLFAAVQIFAGTIAAYAATLHAARRLGVREKSALLIFAGTAICGASAIAVAAPAVAAKREDTSLAVLSVTIWGLAGMWLYPALLPALHLSATAYALLTGATLHMTGFVAAAAAAGGPACLQTALAVKTARMALLLAVVPLLSWRAAALAPEEGAGAARLPALAGMMAAFAALALLSSFWPAFAPAREALRPLALLCLAIAVAAIGLATDAACVLPSLGRGALTALAGWVALIAAFAAGAGYFGY